MRGLRSVVFRTGHRDWLPKLDDIDACLEKITQIIATANPKAIEVVLVDVPCCFSPAHIFRQAMKQAGKEMPLKETIISIKDKKL